MPGLVSPVTDLVCWWNETMQEYSMFAVTAVYNIMLVTKCNRYILYIYVNVIVIITYALSNNTMD